jgi:hypothetical protein
MKNYHLLAIALLTLSSCGVRSGSQTADKSDSAKTSPDTAVTTKKLIAEISIKDTIKAGDSVLLKFTVKTTQQIPPAFANGTHRLNP